MIQFNLLPDVKVASIKANRLKRIMMIVSVLVIIFSIAIVILSYSFVAVQKRHVGNLDKDITRLIAEIESIPELENILTVQNQLRSLPQLYAGRPAVNRLPQYLDQTTPTKVSLSRLSVDFSTSSFNIVGRADSLETVNLYVDTLKQTFFKVGKDGTPAQAFTGVVLSSFGRDDKGAGFTIAFTFDPLIFDNSQDISLVIGSAAQTRDQAEGADSDLFQEETTEGAQ